MIKGIIGKKIGMTQVFDENGRAIPVTVIQAGPPQVGKRTEAAVEFSGKGTGAGLPGSRSVAQCLHAPGGLLHR